MISLNWVKFLLSVIILTLLSAVNIGCAETKLGYIFSAGLGQFNVLTNSVTIDEALANPNTKADLEDKLLWIQALRAYAKDTLKLEGENNFSTFYDTGDGPAVYNLSASKKDELSPLTWTFPILGEIQYLGYFDLDQATQKAQALRDKNYDVVVYGAIAYSTLGYFRDPIFSSILDLEKGRLAELVFHELTHATVYKASDSEFNESVASFIGKTAAIKFINETQGQDSEILQNYEDYAADELIVNQFCNDLYEDLQEYYNRTDLTSDEKIVGREFIFESARQRFMAEIQPALTNQTRYSSLVDLPTSNAWILLHYRYNKDMSIFENTYEACDCDILQTIAVFKQAAQHTDSYQYLQSYLTTHTN